MTEPQHPIDHLLREFATEAEMSEEVRAGARQRLDQAMREETARIQRRRNRTRLAAVAAALAVVAFLVFTLPGGAPPARASMEEIARILEEIDPVEATDTQWVQMSSEQSGIGVFEAEGREIAYRLHRSRQEWWGNDGTHHFETIAHDPVFFSPEDEATYYRVGQDQQDQLGEEVSLTVVNPREELPTDRQELDRLIRQRLPGDRPQDVEYLETALNMLFHSFDSPALRSTLLLLTGELEDLVVGGEGPDGLHLFHVLYHDDERGTDMRLTFGVDDAGFLRYMESVFVDGYEEYGIPPGTVAFSATWTVPTLSGHPTEEQ